MFKYLLVGIIMVLFNFFDRLYYGVYGFFINGIKNKKKFKFLFYKIRILMC